MVELGMSVYIKGVLLCREWPQLPVHPNLPHDVIWPPLSCVRPECHEEARNGGSLKDRVSFAVQFCEPFLLAYLSPRNSGNKRKGEHTFGNTYSTLSASSLCLL